MIYKTLDDFIARASEIRASLRDNIEIELYDKAISFINANKISTFQQKYADQLKDFVIDSMYKYADFPYWISKNIRRATRLHLIEGTPKNILDIGVGPGHFAVIANSLGHRTVGIDLDVDFYNDLCEAIGVDRRFVKVEAQNKLPNFGVKFDLITIMWQSFDIKKYNADQTRVYWDNDDWAYLINDFIENQLNSHGEIYIELNKIKLNQDTILDFDRNLMDMCLANGANVDFSAGIIHFKEPRKKIENVKKN